MMVDSTVTSKGQITIPKEIRDFMHLDAGNTVRFITKKDGTCTLIPMRSRLSELAGRLSLPPGKKILSSEEIKEVIADAVVERYLRDSD